MTGLSASVNVLFSNQYADITTKHTTLQDELWKILVASLHVRLMEITKGCFFVSQISNKFIFIIFAT